MCNDAIGIGIVESPQNLIRPNAVPQPIYPLPRIDKYIQLRLRKLEFAVIYIQPNILKRQAHRSLDSANESPVLPASLSV